MTLRRLNPNTGPSVIDRTDDSAFCPVQVVAVGERGLFLDSLIDAMRHSGIIAWWGDWGAPTALLDHLKTQSVDLVLINLDASGYSRDARNLIRLLARHGILAIVLDRSAHPAHGDSRVEAGALWAVNPSLANIVELDSAIHTAAAQRTKALHQRHRATLARQAWAGAVRGSMTRDSSILTMRRAGRGSDNADNRTRRPSGPSGKEVVATGGLTGGEQGRQV